MYVAVAREDSRGVQRVSVVIASLCDGVILVCPTLEATGASFRVTMKVSS